MNNERLVKTLQVNGGQIWIFKEDRTYSESCSHVGYKKGICKNCFFSEELQNMMVELVRSNK